MHEEEQLYNKLQHREDEDEEDQVSTGKRMIQHHVQGDDREYDGEDKPDRIRFERTVVLLMLLMFVMLVMLVLLMLLMFVMLVMLVIMHVIMPVSLVASHL